MTPGSRDRPARIGLRGRGNHRSNRSPPIAARDSSRETRGLHEQNSPMQSRRPPVLDCPHPIGRGPS